MTPQGWVALAAWAVLGLPVAVRVTRWVYADDEKVGDAWLGWSTITAWVLVPVLVVVAVGVTVSAAIGRRVRAFAQDEKQERADA